VDRTDEIIQLARNLGLDPGGVVASGRRSTRNSGRSQKGLDQLLDSGDRVRSRLRGKPDLDNRSPGITAAKRVAAAAWSCWLSTTAASDNVGP